MPDLPNFPIPDDLTPDTFCLELQIPNDPTWVQTFVGLLAQPTYWFNWDRDPSHSGRALAQYWTKLFDQIDWSKMSCCEPPLIRLNSDGSISVSTDGGATYHTDNNQDPRYTSPQFPPIPGDDGADKKCKAANSIVRQMKDQQIGYSATIGTVTTLLAMAALLVGLAVLVFATAGLATFLIGGFFELAGALLGTTSDAYNALFDDDGWSWILCEMFCKMDDTGQIPASEFVNIQSDFDAHFSGDAALTFSSILGAWALPGLNNAAKIPTTDNLSCDGCCVECGSDWTCPAAAFGGGNVISHIGSVWEIDSTDVGGGNFGIGIQSPATDACCRCVIDFGEGWLGGFVDWTPCGTEPSTGGSTPGFLNDTTCINFLWAYQAAPFHWTLTFSECP